MRIPNHTRMNWLEAVRLRSSWALLLRMVGAYFAIAILFAGAYYFFVPISKEQSDPPHPFPRFSDIASALSVVCEATGDRNSELRSALRKEMIKTGEDFLTACYFSVVTGATVGYGDYTPQNRLGRAIVIRLIGGHL